MIMEIVISIQSIKDLEKFENKLFFYRSFLCRFVHFSNYKSFILIDFVLDALNIKSRKARIEYIYDTLCCQIDSYYRDKNLCQFHKNQCLVQRKNKKYENGCCRLCKYASRQGCTTSNFTCKMFYCESAKLGNSTLKNDNLILLKCLGIRQRILLQHDFFSSREEVIQDLWWESLFINLFRIFPRFISNIVLKKR